MHKAYIAQVADSVDSKLNELSSALQWMGWADIKPGSKVFIKPNLTYPFYKPGVTTSSQAIEALVSILSAQTPNITIGESDGSSHAWKAEDAFHSRQFLAIRCGTAFCYSA